MKDVLVSVVNGNDRGYIYECVASIGAKTKGVTFDVVVIDNCTGDPNLVRLEDMGAEVLHNAERFGFARNHSRVLERLGGYRYLLIFNDDAFFENDVLGLMVEAMDKCRDVAISGPRIQDPDGTLQPSSAKFPNIGYFVLNSLGLDRRKGQRYSAFFGDSIDYTRTQNVEWLSGCCMLIRVEFVREHGFLDTGFFMFLEDTDLCRRAYKAGYKVRYLAGPRVVHHGAASSKDGNARFRPLLVVEQERSRLRYLRRFAPMQYFAYLPFVYLYFFARVLRSFDAHRRQHSREMLALVLRRPLI